MGRLVAFVVGCHFATIHSWAVRDKHFVAVGLASHNLEAVLHLLCHNTGRCHLLLVGEVDEIAVLVIDLEADSSFSVDVVGGQARAGGCGVEVAIGLVLIYEVAPLADELYSLMFIDGNPAGVKSALHTLGRIENQLRLPLVPVTAQTDRRIAEILKQMA